MYDYLARIERVVDGDTVRVMLDHGMYIRSSNSIRLLEVWAPELNQPGGQDAKAAALQWVEGHTHGVEWPLRIVTQKDKQTFNRYVGEVSCATCGESMNAAMREFIARLY